MEASSLRKAILIVFSVLLGPAALLGVSPPRGSSSAATSASSNWNFPKEAQRLLNNLKVDSSQVRDIASTLQGYNDEIFLIDWRTEGELLRNVRQEVNQMDTIERRLRVIARVADPGQRAVIRRVVPQIILLTDETNSAIDFLNSHPDQLWLPKYAAYADEMYNSTGMIDHYLRNPQVYAAARVQTAQSPKS